MASGKRGSTGPAGQTPRRPRRPAPTIELTAPEVANAPAAAPAESPIEAAPVAAAGMAPSPQAAAVSETAPGPQPSAPADAPRAASEPPAAAETAAPPPPPDPNGFQAAKGWPPLDAWLPDEVPWPLVGAGAAGAAATLAVLGLLWLLGAFAPSDGRTTALAAKVAMMELQMREIAGRPAAAPADVVAAVDPKQFEDIGGRLAAAEQMLRRFALIEPRLAKMESEAASRPAVTDPALVRRLDAVDAALRRLTTEARDLAGRIGETATAARDARTQADAAAAKAAESVSAATAAADAFRKATAAPPPAPAPAVAPAAVTALADRIEAVERIAKVLDARAAKPQPSADLPLRRAVLAVALRMAAERGGPFAAELAAFTPIAADAAALAPLAAVADKGLPSPAALRQELSKLSPAILAAAGTAPREGGMLDRLQANAERLVRIRPIDAAAGDDPAAVLARAETRTAAGDLAAAVAELGRLPAAARAPAAQWIQAAQARIAALETARKLAADALAALGTAQ